MSLALNEPHEIGCSPFKLGHYLQACTTTGQEFLILYVKQSIENHMELTLDSNLLQGWTVHFIHSRINFSFLGALQGI